MTGGQRVKLTAKRSNTEINGILKYSNDDLYIVRDDCTGTESIYPSRRYTIEKIEEGKNERINQSPDER